MIRMDRCRNEGVKRRLGEKEKMSDGVDQNQNILEWFRLVE